MGRIYYTSSAPYLLLAFPCFPSYLVYVRPPFLFFCPCHHLANQPLNSQYGIRTGHQYLYQYSFHSPKRSNLSWACIPWYVVTLNLTGIHLTCHTTYRDDSFRFDRFQGVQSGEDLVAKDLAAGLAGECGFNSNRPN